MTETTGRPLVQKLGIEEGARVALLGAPERFPGPPPEGTELLRDEAVHRDDADFDVIVVFAPDRRRLEETLPAVVPRLTAAGRLWLAWPKKSSGVASDLSDAAVQAVGLSTGLVDNKTCSVDAVWSALRFVVRREDRASWPAAPERRRRRGA